MTANRHPLDTPSGPRIVDADVWDAATGMQEAKALLEQSTMSLLADPATTAEQLYTVRQLATVWVRLDGALGSMYDHVERLDEGSDEHDDGEGRS